VTVTLEVTVTFLYAPISSGRKVCGQGKALSYAYATTSATSSRRKLSTWLAESAPMVIP
jgi:hypothetical protein